MKFDFDKNSNALNERLIQTAADNINNNAENSAENTAELTGKSLTSKLDMRQFTLDQTLDMMKTQLQHRGFVEKDAKKPFKTFPCYRFHYTYFGRPRIDIYLGAGVTPKHHKKYRLYLHNIYLHPDIGWDGCSFGIYINGKNSHINIEDIQEWFGFYINILKVGTLNPNFKEDETPWDNFNNLLLMVDILMKNIEPIKKLIEHEADRLYDNGYMPSKREDNIAEQTSKNIGLYGILEIILRENRISNTNIPGYLRKKVLSL